MPDRREDYGPPGCAGGCAETIGSGCLLVIVAGLVALVGVGRAVRRGGRR